MAARLSLLQRERGAGRREEKEVSGERESGSMFFFFARACARGLPLSGREADSSPHARGPQQLGGGLLPPARPPPQRVAGQAHHPLRGWAGWVAGAHPSARERGRAGGGVQRAPPSLPSRFFASQTLPPSGSPHRDPPRPIPRPARPPNRERYTRRWVEGVPLCPWTRTRSGCRRLGGGGGEERGRGRA